MNPGCPHSLRFAPGPCSQCLGIKPSVRVLLPPSPDPDSPAAFAIASGARVAALGRQPSRLAPRAAADRVAKPKLPPMPTDGSWTTLQELLRRVGLGKGGLDRYRERGALSGEQLFAGKRLAFPTAIAEAFLAQLAARAA